MSILGQDNFVCVCACLWCELGTRNALERTGTNKSPIGAGSPLLEKRVQNQVRYKEKDNGMSSTYTIHKPVWGLGEGGSFNVSLAHRALKERLRLSPRDGHAVIAFPFPS